MKYAVPLLPDLLHLFFPRICAACGAELIKDELLCLSCLQSLSATNFSRLQDNPVARIFEGRIPLAFATAGFYFSKNGVMQQLVHACKYHGRKDLIAFFGQWLGRILREDPYFIMPDFIIAVPLFPARERQRGYNQSALLAEEIAGIIERPFLSSAVIRRKYTDSQTHKSRVERWENVRESFSLKKEKQLEGKHVLLIDDVVTTGATLEACGQCILQAKGAKLSMAALTWAGE